MSGTATGVTSSNHVLPPAGRTLSPPELMTALGAPPTPTRKEIYRQISQYICQVETEQGKATGVYLFNNLIAVPFHVLTMEQVETPTGIGYKSRPIRCVYDGVVYSAEAAISNDISFGIDCAIYGITDRDFPARTPLPITEGKLIPGEDVYFGGFPLTQTAPTFHSGSISSVSDDEFNSFTIDGTVVPGSSGGPVFVIEGGFLKLAGIIFQQIADFSPEDRETIEILEFFKQNPSGMIRSVTLNTPQGPKERRVADSETIVLAFDLIRRNLSTGIGRAFHIMYLDALLKGQAFTLPPASLRMLGMVVNRKDRLPQTYTAKDMKVYFTHCDGHEGKHLKLSRKMKPKDLVKSTVGSAATFYSEAAQNYSTLLKKAISGWADAGAPTPSYFTFDTPIGADEGHETKTVEIYYGDKIGSHMRPKFTE